MISAHDRETIDAVDDLNIGEELASKVLDAINGYTVRQALIAFGMVIGDLDASFPSRYGLVEHVTLVDNCARFRRMRHRGETSYEEVRVPGKQN